MTTVAPSYNIHPIELNTKLKAVGLQSNQVKDIKKAIGNVKIWNALDGKADLQTIKLNLVAVGGKDDSQPTPVDPNDLHVTQIAIFAVHEYNVKHETQLVFKKVVAGLELTVSLGTFYWLSIVTHDDKGTHIDRAQVFESITGLKTLTEYTHEGN